MLEIIIVVLAGVTIGAAAYLNDRFNWNDGRCRECKTIWRCFDVDSQGGRGYKCSQGHGTWISWLRERPIDPLGFTK